MVGSVGRVGERRVLTVGARTFAGAASWFPSRVGELAAAAGDPRLDGADRDVERLGDLGVVEVGDVAQHDRHPELLGQLGERGVDRHRSATPRRCAVGERVDGLGRCSSSSRDDVERGRRLRRRSSSRAALVAMR